MADLVSSTLTSRQWFTPHASPFLVTHYTLWPTHRGRPLLPRHGRHYSHFVVTAPHIGLSYNRRFIPIAQTRYHPIPPSVVSPFVSMYTFHGHSSYCHLIRQGDSSHHIPSTLIYSSTKASHLCNSSHHHSAYIKLNLYMERNHHLVPRMVRSLDGSRRAHYGLGTAPNNNKHNTSIINNNLINLGLISQVS